MKVFRSPKEKLPKKGESLIVWKKILEINNQYYKRKLLCKLRIPARARRVEPERSGGKCRAERALVVSIERACGARKTGKKLKKGCSYFDPRFVYETGKTVIPKTHSRRKGFDGRDSWVCTTGIHFFKTKAEARRYKF